MFWSWFVVALTGLSAIMAFVLAFFATIAAIEDRDGGLFLIAVLAWCVCATAIAGTISLAIGAS